MENKKRLIDAVRYSEVLERYINAPHVKVFGKYSDGMQLAINTCIELLNSQRTVDAVEVVRCKDCKHSYEGVANIMCGRCGQNINGIRLGGVSVKEEHFCSYGERRTE